MDEKKEKVVAWGTADECKFIDRLGHQAEGLRGISRSELLERLSTAYASRVNWGDIDRAKVEAHLAAALLKAPQ